jgi:class 3 adenylate cyclase/tetratricopeptide (TPR) repeat protein
VNIEAWLTGLGLDQYAEAFAENEIDGGTLPALTGDDLKEIGVGPLGHRKKLLAAIAELTAAGPTTGEEPSTAPAGERRQVTVLFADLSGYTQLSAALDAEELHGVMARVFEVIDGVVEDYGGTVDKHIGDAVMALFGAPIAHGDDPLRAVRAALDIHQAMPALSDELGHPLAVHLGVASGSVIAGGVGNDARGEYTVLGDSVNLASRLDEMAGPGETLISDAVKRVVANEVDCEALGEVEVKGLDAPVRAWRVRALRAAGEPAARSAFVGRRGGLRQFAGTVEACRESGHGEVIVVRGEAGMGKTRLVEEFTAIALDNGFTPHKGLVLDFGVGKGQDAVRTIVRSLLGIASGSGKRFRGNAADTAVAGGLVAERARVFLNDLLDLAQPHDDRAMYEAMDNTTRNDGKRAVVKGLIRAVSERAPILVIVEDVHWADPLLLAYLATIASTVADCPAVLVTTTRVEGDPLDQAWRGATGGSPLMTIDLRPLRADEAANMAEGFIDASNQFARDCVARAAGNPLFLEQLLRGAKDRGEGDLPASIQSLVLARMDRLSAVDKWALQVASVIGQRFTLDTLHHLLDDDTYACRDLIAHHLVRPEGDGYLFAHSLIQEGVYASLLKATRRELHASAAAWFADHDPTLRAQHLDRAEDPAAPRAYLEASQAQALAYHFERASALVRRGIEISDDDGERSALTRFHGELLHNVGAFSDSIEAYRAAHDLAVDDIGRCRTWIGLASSMRMVDDYDDALAALDQAQSVAEDEDLPGELSRIHELRGQLYFTLGKVDECLEAQTRALEFARAAGSPELEALALGGLGDAAYAQGRMITAYGHFERCFELCQEHGMGRIEVSYSVMVGQTQCYLNEFPAALESSMRVIEAAARVGHQRAELLGRTVMIWALIESGDWVSAIEHADKALVTTRRLGTPRFEAELLTHRANILHCQGKGAEAVELLNQAIAICRETGLGYFGPYALGRLALVTDDDEVRRESLREGEELLQAGSVSHNFIEFYRTAIETSLITGEWDEVERYASALEDYTRAEPLAWPDFIIARGRAMAAHGRGKRDDATMHELERLRDEAKRSGLKLAMWELDEALANVEP